MAAIAHASAVQTTQQTTTSASYVDITGAAIASGNFTAGKKYLILACAHIGDSTSNQNSKIRCLHGTTAFADSENFWGCGTGDRRIWNFWTIWTAVSGEGIKLQFNITAGGTAAADHITLVAINLSDDLNENVDWFFAERTADDGLSTTYTDGAALTWAPGTAGQVWLILSLARIDFGDTVNSVFSRIERSGEVASTTPEARELANSALFATVIPLARAFTLGAVSNTFKERAATSAGTAHTRLYSSIFALNLSKFRNHAFAYTDGAVNLGTTDYATALQTIGITPDIAGDVLIIGYWTFDQNDSANKAESRLQVDDADQPAGQTADNYQLRTRQTVDTNEDPEFFIAMVSMTAAAHTVDLDGSVSATTGTPTGKHRTVAAFTMELPAAGGGGSGGGAKYHYDNMMRDAA